MDLNGNTEKVTNVGRTARGIMGDIDENLYVIIKNENGDVKKITNNGDVGNLPRFQPQFLKIT